MVLAFAEALSLRLITAIPPVFVGQGSQPVKEMRAALGHSSFARLLTVAASPRNVARPNEVGDQHTGMTPFGQATPAMYRASSTRAGVSAESVASTAQPGVTASANTTPAQRTVRPTCLIPLDCRCFFMAVLPELRSLFDDTNASRAKADKGTKHHSFGATVSSFNRALQPRART
jgi:hypothetical protein